MNKWLLRTFIALTCVLSFCNGADVCTEDYPPQYIVHKLQPGEKIDLDGRLSEDAWNVPEMGPLVDLAGGPMGPTPYRKTRTVMRYDDKCLYVGAVLEEPQAWANHTEENTPIFQDNDFEVFVDAGGEFHHYKELEISATNVRWNLLMVRPYVNGGPAVCNTTVPNLCSATDPAHGVFSTYDIRRTWRTATAVDGAVNDPVRGSRSWSLEMCVPIKDMLVYSHAEPPRHNTFWHANVMRVQWHVHVEHHPNGTAYYAKDAAPCDNWAWAPTGAVNVHLPDRWGFLQFSEEAPRRTAPLNNPSYPLRRVLIKVYEAEHNYAELHGGEFTSNIDQLVTESGFDRDLLACVMRNSLVIGTRHGEFAAKATSLDGTLLGAITHDRQFTLTVNK